uniref:M-specific ORF protein n=1 Tax=Unio delphinus TaxID=461120 RepID=A0A1P8AFZ7_9BIVA|nr:M-specific ORF protein [Unio delphinus]
MNITHDLIKWVKHCFGLSPVVAFIIFFIFFFVLSLMIFGLFRAVSLYWSSIYNSTMMVMMGSSWFVDKSAGDSKDEKVVVNGSISLDKNNVGEVGTVGLCEQDDSKKFVDISSLKDILKDILKEIVKEAVKEAMKNAMVKEAKKKKDGAVSADLTAVKKKSKKVLAKEMGDTISEVDNQGTTPTKKKKSKKVELVDKEVDLNK